MERFVVFESKEDDASISEATKLFSIPEGESGPVTFQAIGGCTPGACRAIFKWMKASPRFLNEGNHSKLGSYLVLEPIGNLGGKWVSILQALIKTELTNDRKAILEYLGYQSGLQLFEAEILFPEIQNCILDSDSQIRYFARKARENLQTLFPSLRGWENGKIQEVPKETKSSIEPQEILLRKIKLGSRYIVYEALDRLTESQDPNLATPLLDFLKEEPDLYKVSHLLKSIGRIKDPRIPLALEEWLNHPEPRVVANALEGLSFCEVPSLKEIFLKFSRSEDNRIRANAVRALYRYDPKNAKKNLEEMIVSDNIALQDSGLFLIGILVPDNFDSLIDSAINSKFPSIRLNALDLLKQSIIAQRTKSREKSNETPEDEGFWGLLGSLAIGSCLGFASTISPNFVGTFLFALPILLFALMFLRQGLVTQKMCIVSVFIASLGFGSDTILAILGIMAIWLGNLRIGSENRLNGVVIVPWIIVIFAFLLNQFQLNGHTGFLDALSHIGASQGVKDPIILKIIDDRKIFQQLNFLAVSAIVIFIILGNKWYASKQNDDSKKKFFVGSAVAGCFISFLLQIIHYFNLNVYLVTQGFGDSGSLLKLLLK